ncbi:SDR family NAD(P)-dependent oxidoreductase [Candidimonas nitroreducens]|uniref:SDR family NAD(P)-dependent oxidoreductase n=1 Tax=Candidimonas nitroreducens TaxID=683354 RepID=UPI0038BB5B74
MGCFLGMKMAAEVMRRAKNGSIINVSSIAGLRGSRSFAYSATKWALRGMSRSAALTLATDNVRVNSVHPGVIDTGLLWISPRNTGHQLTLGLIIPDAA